MINSLSRLNRYHFLVAFLFVGFVGCAQQQKEQPVLTTEVSYSAPEVNQVLTYVTARNTNDRISPVDILSFTDQAQPDESFPTIMLDATKRFQTIVGIGGAFTDAAAETFYKLPKDKQREIITNYFSPDSGIGYTIGRTQINSCDFSSDSYAYDETPGDTALKNFSIGHDLKYRVPFIKEALAETGGDITLFASPWSPPAWMKTNNNMLHGGKLKAEYRQTWANYYVKFINAYKKQGIDIWGLTVQNEPMATQTWESCIFTGQDEHDFVKNYLGPTLEKSGMSDIKLMVWDHNRGIMYQRAAAVLEDPQAAKYVWGVGFHWYVGDHFENTQLVHEAFPNKKLMLTEATLYPYDATKLHEWHWGEKYGKNIINDLNHWSVGWTDWNLILDQQGGPNHVANFCYAPIIANTNTGKLTYMNSFYYIGQFSKFIRPGAKRIICSSNNDDLIATAFINPDGSIATVIMNETDQSMDYKIWIEGKIVTAKSLAHSITTAVLK